MVHITAHRKPSAPWHTIKKLNRSGEIKPTPFLPRPTVVDPIAGAEREVGTLGMRFAAVSESSNATCASVLFLMPEDCSDENWLIPAVRASSLLLGAVLLLAGCESKGPAEKAGERIDNSVQDAKDAINPPGPVEEAGRAVDKAVKP
ncbi:hypothetical protein V5E97_36595 [Singulisphaera sp. Ch08]|uniref:Lipoprotein n=1 Tax=Singulisphaera sp. Ch08 TaxID=3120278 RepID=A0AAU7CFS8_9BACT